MNRYLRWVIPGLVLIAVGVAVSIMAGSSNDESPPGADAPGIVVFVSEDCPFCDETVDLIEESADGVPVGVVPIDPGIAERYDITTTPMIEIHDRNGDAVGGRYAGVLYQAQATAIVADACAALGGVFDSHSETCDLNPE